MKLGRQSLHRCAAFKPRSSLPSSLRAIHTSRFCLQDAGGSNGSSSPVENERGKSSSSSAPQVVQRPNLLEVKWPSGSTSKFHNVFLRDHCQCPACRHEVTKQRLYDTYNIPLDIAPADVNTSGTGVDISWSGEDPHKCTFSWQWLLSNSYSPRLLEESADEQHLPEKTLWSTQIASSPPTVSYDAAMKTDEGVLDWLKKIYRFGFAFVDGCPPTPEATEELIRRISFIRETHYGGFWDFTADLAHGDTAYTNIELGAHTDTTYFSDPCGLQMFHLLSPPDSHQGGKSVLVDGFRAAHLLKLAHPACYELLSTLPIPTHASGGPDTLIRPTVARPVLEHDIDGHLAIVRWNGDDRAVIGQGLAWQGEVQLDDGRLVDKVTGFYEALKVWERLLRSEDSQYWFQLESGKPMIFDNQRVLHGRSSFTGSRRMCGAYIAGDDYLSRLRTLTRKIEQKNWP